MESLGSDTESECFESAEESLDESSEFESVKRKSKKSLSKNEREVVEPVFSNHNTLDSVGQLEENISDLSYRKRPERMKRSFSKPLRKFVSKSPSNEVIYNAEKVVSDVFFQDITSSLSKNINKSLNTLQQTSSNVKDLILNSLPLSNINDKEEFSYDDKNISLTVLDSNAETNSQFNDQSHISPSVREKVAGNKEKDIEGSLRFSETATNTSTACSMSSSDIVVDKPGNIRTNNLKNKNYKSKDSIIDDIVKKEMSTFKEEVSERDFDSSSSSEYLSKAERDELQQNLKTVSEKTKDDLQNSYQTDSIHINSHIPNDQEKTINQENSVYKNQQYEKFDNSKEKCTKTVELLNNEPIVLQDNNLEQIVLDNLSQEKNLIYSKIINDDGSSSSKDGNNYISLPKNKNEVISDFNLEELKTALKNIFEEEKNSSEIIKSSIENKILKEDCTLEEKVKDNLNSNDGWDDFDFSDDEIENIKQNERDISVEKEERNSNDEVLEKNKVKVDSETSTILSKNVEVKNQKPEVPVLSPDNCKNNSVSKTKPPKKSIKNADSNMVIRNNKVEDNKKIIKPIESSKSKSACEDLWDWDNWDEITDNKEKIKFNSAENPPKKTEKEDFFDASKWSGWDTFGQKLQPKPRNWNLGSWGVDVLLNKATSVTQGISNAIETGLGAPDPETLLRLEIEERKKLKEHEIEKEKVGFEEPSAENSKKNSLTNVSFFPVSGFTNLVAGVTSKIVEHSKIQELGSKVISGGLDTLETFGKKTMEVLQEGDPGLKNKRALLLGNNKPVLSQVLKEAREKAEKEMKKAEEKEIAKKCHFETLFDDFQGMVHLEALEMLSRQGELKLDQIRNGMNSEELEDLNGILEEVEQLCSLEEFNIDLKSSVVDYKTALQMAVEPLKNEISIQKIIEIFEDVNKWLKMATETKPSIILINQKLVSTLAELTAATVHQFHKSGELLSVKECRKTVEEVDALSRLTNVLCKEISTLSEKFLLLSQSTGHMDGNVNNMNSFNEKVAVVVNNSMLYIRQAFNLLIPVIQLGAAV